MTRKEKKKVKELTGKGYTKEEVKAYYAAMGKWPTPINPDEHLWAIRVALKVPFGSEFLEGACWLDSNPEKRGWLMNITDVAFPTVVQAGTVDRMFIRICDWLEMETLLSPVCMATGDTLSIKPGDLGLEVLVKALAGQKKGDIKSVPLKRKNR